MRGKTGHERFSEQLCRDPSFPFPCKDGIRKKNWATALRRVRNVWLRRNLSLPMGCCFHAARTAHSVVVPKRVIGSFCTCLGLPTYKPTYRSTLHNHSNLKSVRSPKPPSPENKKANPNYICAHTFAYIHIHRHIHIHSRLLICL